MDKIIYNKPHNGVILKKRPYKGVTYNKTAKRYIAYIRVDGKQKYLGGYKTLKEALAIRQRAEREVNDNG